MVRVMAHDTWIILAAFLLELVVGYPGWLMQRISHPVVWMGALLTQLESRLNRSTFSASGQKILGAVALAVLLILVGIVAWALSQLGIIVQLVSIASLLATRNLYRHVHNVATALHENIQKGREAVSHIVGRDVSSLDKQGVSRAAIESLAESFCDGVVAPFFFLLIGGLPGLAIYKAINTADSMIGHKDARYLHFGWAAARLDDVANYAPARVAAALIALASGKRVLHTFHIIQRDAKLHASPNAGYPEAAMAGALGLKLAGPASYDGALHDAPFIGDGSAEANPLDITRALRMYTLANALMLLLVVFVVWIS